MRVVVLRTHTNNCPALYESLRTLGHQLSVITYDVISPDAFNCLPWMVDEHDPAWVLMIGAHHDYHPRPVPPVGVLAKIGERRPLVHLCCDGAEPVWWKQIQDYYDHGNFALQINIDGVRTGPIGDRGLTLLSPIDSSLYPDPPAPWSSRRVELGFSGSVGAPSHDRGRLIDELTRKNVLMVRRREHDGTGEAYREFLSTCRCVLNHPATGGTTRTHVKGRPIETALAGALVLEHVSSPLENWFDAGIDYLTYDTTADVARQVRWVREQSEEARRMAARMREKVLREHAPSVFWGHVLEAIGLGPACDVALRSLPSRRWSMSEALGDTGSTTSSSSPSPSSANGAPMLVHTKNGLNVVHYAGTFYVAPHHLGPIDLWRTEHQEMDGVLKFRTETEALRAIS